MTNKTQNNQVKKKYNSKMQTQKNQEAIEKIIKHYKDEPYIASLRWMYEDAKKKFKITMSEKTFYRRIEKEDYALCDNRLTKMYVVNIYKHSELISNHFYNKHFAFRLKKTPYAPLVVKILNSKLGKENFYCTNINEIILCFYDSTSIEKIFDTKQSENSSTDAEHSKEDVHQNESPTYWLKKIKDILDQSEFDNSIY